MKVQETWATWRYKDLKNLSSYQTINTCQACCNFPPFRLLCYSEECTFYSVHFLSSFKNTIMNSRTFTEKLCSLDSIKLNYQNLSAGTDKPLITKWEWTKGWTSWTCWTHFKDKKLVCKLYKYASWNAYLHDFRDWHQCKYSYIQGQVA